MTLRGHMEAVLAEWPAGVPQVWQDRLGGAAPNFEAIPIDLPHDGAARPAYPPLQADNGRHLSRAFRQIEPARVRVVVIGQDPYTQPARSTGRSFEDGAAQGGNVATSLKRLLQSALQAPPNGDNWNSIRERVVEHLPDQPAMTRYFDGLAGQGVLFLNVGWTFTHLDHRKAHYDLWQPVNERLLQDMAREEEGGTVFLLLGKTAQTLFRNSLPKNVLEELRGEGRGIVPIDHPHPAAHHNAAYLNGVNPLGRVNQDLLGLGEDEIIWWPPRPENAA